MKTNTVMKKNEKYMIKPLNEKEQKNVNGGICICGMYSMLLLFLYLLHKYDKKHR